MAVQINTSPHTAIWPTDCRSEPVWGICSMSGVGGRYAD
jgi:hypothetical protein